MRTARDYGAYAALLRKPAIRKLVKTMNAISKRLRIPYMVIGGSAVYLQTRRNPVDYPDLDIVLDATKTGAKKFVKALKGRLKMNVEKLAETEPDVFYKVYYRGFDIDVFTEQEDRPNLGLPVKIHDIPVKRIEGLIAEKLGRFSYPDILMLFDLLRKKYDRDMVREYAHRIGALGRLTTMQKILAARPSVSTLRRWATIMAGGERRGHFV